MTKKIYSTVYNTLKGGYCMNHLDADGNVSNTEWQYTCLYDKIRFTYSSIVLREGWIHRSIHWNNIINGGIAWDFHIAYRKKYPFIKIGFNSIKNLYKE